jgi:hypothetical protein
MNQRRAAIAIRVRLDVAGGLSTGATSKGIVNVTHLMSQLKRLTRDCGLGLFALALVWVVDVTGDAGEGKTPLAAESLADNSIVDRLVPEGFVDELDRKPQEAGFKGIYSFVLDLPGLALRGSSVSGKQK